jgi:hypothetical protein
MLSENWLYLYMHLYIWEPPIHLQQTDHHAQIYK